MKKCKFYLLILCSILAESIYAQELVQVTDETLTVNSVTAMTGYTRNKTEVTLPDRTSGYIYRISVFPKGTNPAGPSLFSLLKKLGSSNISLASSFAEYAIANNDNSSVDAFIFSSPDDANNFYAKKDGYWNACKSMPNRVSCCFATKECMGKEVYFGFRNNNIMKGLDVKLEVVALVE